MVHRPGILTAKAFLAVALVVGSAAAASTARGQCCLGAQDIVATSANGRYSVEATSLAGTGPMEHGPYSYRFGWTQLGPEGNPLSTNSFDVMFDSTDHFNMNIYVSDTGNGFLLDTELLPHATFYGPDGVIQQRHLKPDRYLDLIAYRGEHTNGCTLPLRFPREERGPDAVSTDERDLYFLPLGGVVSEALDEQILNLLEAEGQPDLGLLGCLLTYPSAEVVSAAGARLESILPPDFDGSRAWVTEHELQLQWVEELGKFAVHGNE